jgi:hypothetical protein
LKPLFITTLILITNPYYSCSDTDFLGNASSSYKEASTEQETNENKNFGNGENETIDGAASGEHNSSDNTDLNSGSGGGECTLEDIITFEDQSEVDTEISDQYVNSHGVSFALDSGDYPEVAASGSGTQWHRCDSSPTDKCQDSKNGIKPSSLNIVETRFIGARLGSSGSLIITYSNPVSAASGFLIDADGDEFFEVEAFDDSGNKVASDVSIDARGKSGDWKDGAATKFELRDGQGRISKVTIKGSKPGGNPGISFDYFSPSKICN